MRVTPFVFERDWGVPGLGGIGSVDIRPRSQGGCRLRDGNHHHGNNKSEVDLPCAFAATDRQKQAPVLIPCIRRCSMTHCSSASSRWIRLLTVYACALSTICSKHFRLFEERGSAFPYRRCLRSFAIRQPSREIEGAACSPHRGSCGAWAPPVAETYNIASCFRVNVSARSRTDP